jgi:transcriptional regulator with XRE-family HTH domain
MKADKSLSESNALDLRSFVFFNEISQKELAEYLGISNGYMSKLVSGTAKLKKEQLTKILNNDKGWSADFLVGAEPIIGWRKIRVSNPVFGNGLHETPIGTAIVHDGYYLILEDLIEQLPKIV